MSKHTIGKADPSLQPLLIRNEREFYNARLILSPHFTASEFVDSATARLHHIDNTPSREALENLASLCRYTLEPLREALGLPIIITSGYRCPELNGIIARSSRNSQHTLGQAADFYVGWMPPLDGRGQTMDDFDFDKRLDRAFRTIVERADIDFDQLIRYPHFIHVSYASDVVNRHSVLVADGMGKYTVVGRGRGVA